MASRQPWRLGFGLALCREGERERKESERIGLRGGRARGSYPPPGAVALILARGSIGWPAAVHRAASRHEE